MGHAYHFSRPRRTVQQAFPSPRQRQCLDLLITGWTPKEIAHALECSPRNVCAMLRLMCEHAQCRTTEQLAVWWARRC